MIAAHDAAALQTKVWNKRDLFFGTLQGVALLCILCQVFISPDSDNLNSVAWVAASSCLVFQYLWKSESTIHHPISSLAILGLCITTQFSALVAQTLGWHPFVELLRWPETTFTVLAIVQVTAISTHWVYRHVSAGHAAKAFVSAHILTPLGAFTTPPVTTIWILATIGVSAMAPGGGVATGDVGGKAFQALNFLAYMPFLIPLYIRRFGARYADIKVQGPLLVAYVALMFGVAMALNARQFMVIGPVQVCLIFLTYHLQRSSPVTRQTWMRLGALLATLSIAIVLLGYLATAMVIAREKREKSTPLELISETLKALKDQDKVNDRQAADLAEGEYKVYNESYLRNPLMARFSETKFHDNHIYLATVQTEFEKKDIREVTLDKLLAILPQPFLDALSIKLDKNILVYSFGDYYRYINEGPYNTLGGFATGSVWAHLISLVGLDWFPVACVFLFLPSFIFLDGFCRSGQDFDVSPIALCASWMIFAYSLGGESLVYKASFYCREIPQKVVLYVALAAIIKYSFRLFNVRPAFDEKMAG